MSDFMEQEEVRALVWEELARSPVSLSAAQIADSCGLDVSSILSAVSKLRSARLIEIASPLPVAKYRPSIRLDAMRWANALDLGVPLSVLEKYGKLSSAARADALRIASDGTIEREAQKQAKVKLDARRDLLEGRAATKAAATDLARIEEDARRALDGSHLDAAAEAVLRQVQQQASLAIERLRVSLLVRSGGKN
jgi:hypothetical protein